MDLEKLSNRVQVSSHHTVEQHAALWVSAKITTKIVGFETFWRDFSSRVASPICSVAEWLQLGALTLVPAWQEKLQQTGHGTRCSVCGRHADLLVAEIQCSTAQSLYWPCCEASDQEETL